LVDKTDICILISAGAEWRAWLPHYPEAMVESTPYGDCFQSSLNNHCVCFFHSGWGKVAAAGSAQYAIDQWKPDFIINLGTCGGFRGVIERGAVILAQKTVIYDILEQMTDNDRAIDHYTVKFDLSWLSEAPPQSVTIGTLVSADRDIVPTEIPNLIQKYKASGADWESGAIAWVAKKNGIPCLILRSVSDLVDADVGEAYGNYVFFEEQCQSIMGAFAQHLPAWLNIFCERN
jgi:adenosylhomocysteine nucleosidase